MHYHCEIILPPVKDIEKALEQIMGPFNANCDREDEDNDCFVSFWDFYVAGGRFAGSKEMCAYPENKLSEFYKKINEAKVTVSNFRCGKQSISPESQIPIVDELWNEIFPTEKGEIVPCPLFAHSNNQYDGDDLISCDICRVEEIPADLKCSRVIVAGPSYPEYTNEKLNATFMIAGSAWNGVNHMPVAWDGKVLSALQMVEDKFKHYNPDYLEKIMPHQDWLCITIDYHS